MVSPSLTPPRPGDPIKAALMGLIIDALRERGIGPGTLRTGGNVSVKMPHVDVRIGRVERVIAPNGNVPDAPDEIKYDIRVMRKADDEILTDVRPTLGRPVKGNEARIWPAQVGDYCLILRVYDEGEDNGNYLLLTAMLTEYIATRRCPPPQGGTGGTSPLNFARMMLAAGVRP